MPLFLSAAWTWLSSSKLAQWGLALGTLLLTLMLGYKRAQRQGAAQERQENSSEVLDTIENVKPIQDNLSQLSPDQKREELGKWSK